MRCGRPTTPTPVSDTCRPCGKTFAGRLAAVGDTAIQVFGGIGYTWEHDAHLYLKRLLSFNAFLGGPDRYLTQLGSTLTSDAAHSSPVL